LFFIVLFGIALPVVLATVTQEFTAELLEAPNQLDSFHGTSISSTLRIDGISPLVMSR
jgi:hypothetical protein